MFIWASLTAGGGPDSFVGAAVGAAELEPVSVGAAEIVGLAGAAIELVGEQPASRVKLISATGASSLRARGALGRPSAVVTGAEHRTMTAVNASVSSTHYSRQGYDKTDVTKTSKHQLAALTDHKG
ncbi:hypothetical protein [Subtercola boreus]|uniref:hypothetical protein n=1 Tax=Subtercola boreus TaxID=120213 RepID=UPI0011C074E7|nr:hypothetical protein [Subtercola boreus]